MQKSMRVVTVRKHVHNGSMMKVAEEYETDEANAADLLQLGYVTRAPEAKKNQYRRRDLEAEPL